LRTILIIFITFILGVLGGCNGAVGGKELLTVDFQKGQSLRYRFVSSREISVDLDPTKNASRPGSDTVKKTSESMDMVVVYTPIEINRYGLTTIEATCESVKVKRSSGSHRRDAKKDAVENLVGKSFTLTVTPTGKIEDYSQLDKLIKEIGEKAFRPKSSQGRIKEPDMIDDFIATQWFLWDSVSSIKKPVEGVSIGQSWKSKLSVPTSMVLRKARDVTYSLKEFRQGERGRLAVIHSTYSPAESVPHSWPIPYSGSFRLSGQFGFLIMFVRGFNVRNLQGEGEELFNIDTGRIEKYNQQYQLQLQAASKSLLGTRPQITIKQNLTMQLLE